jgi:hypothetical protein
MEKLYENKIKAVIKSGNIKFRRHFLELLTKTKVLYQHRLTIPHYKRNCVTSFWPMVIKACVGVMCFMAVGEWGCADSGGDGAPWGAFATATDRNGRDKPQF